MATTKKDYIVIAAILKKNTIMSYEDLPFTLKGELINDLCAYFKNDNPNFNAATFKAACKTDKETS